MIEDDKLDAETPADDVESAAETPAKRPPRFGLISAVVLTAASVFGAAAVLGGLWLSGSWDGPSDDDPAESVDGFLTALLKDHDAKDAQSYLCQTLSGDLSGVLQEIDSMGKQDNGAVEFSWSHLKVAGKSAGSAVVTADVSVNVTAETATWTFALVTGDPDDAWRVCGVETGDAKRS
ncbi:MAG TPA: hypothetical protein VE172_25115 [Stackebrandtia sp.]|jgi:hypothetical protein|uniref:hypothetical protein n=1 Tax=Stackebrandtia sp. TaxID=2023065 RepID=UPI002D2A901C|nr:hypothetical protein [Stackebrandtia sp.]HZE42090.1 hypothetical protein [Stackebrandtia sp.]